jgi:hypothetical protein
MQRVQQIKHNGKMIFFMDFSDLISESEIKEVVRESIGFIRIQSTESLLTLTIISGMHFSSKIKDIFNDFIAGNKPYVKAGAVVGLSGLQTIVYNGLMKVTGRNIKSFQTQEAAKDWLTA